MKKTNQNLGFATLFLQLFGFFFCIHLAKNSSECFLTIHGKENSSKQLGISRILELCPAHSEGCSCISHGRACQVSPIHGSSHHQQALPPCLPPSRQHFAICLTGSGTVWQVSLALLLQILKLCGKTKVKQWVTFLSLEFVKILGQWE